MKTELDFSRVPLDKWVDLYNSDTYSFSKCIEDINKFAEVQVKEQADYDKALADACVKWWDEMSTENHFNLVELIDARKKVAKEAKEEIVVRSPVDLSDIPF